MHEDSSNEENEEQIWKKAIIELHQKEIHQQELELINIKKDLLKIKIDVATAQLDKEKTLEKGAILQCKINEILYHKYFLDYQITKTKYEQEENNDLMNLAVKTTNKPENKKADTIADKKKANLTLYSDSDSDSSNNIIVLS